MDRRRNWRNKFFEDSTSRHSKKKITENPECSPTSAEASGNEYEVFLSFMGEDTRKGFTDHLYHRMLDSGICVFKDNVNLPEGKEITYSLSEAIKKSKISIPILSTNYAASKWCLDELVFMMECRKTRKQMVLPIFYDVTPSQVKKQSKSYAIAFSEHHKNYDGETVEKWRKSLVEVASLKGLELEKETGGHEAQLTKLIVAKVLSVLKKAHLLVPDILVGIDNQVNAIIDLLKLSASDVRIVGIWGMGGIGKTTLAKHVYNQILDEFECCSFLKDIRETSLQHKGIEGLQAQLYTNLSKVAHGHNFTSIDEGASELKYRFREKKVLILLDDVDQIHQLNVLAAEVGWFGAGSRIIITTRISDVLDVHPVSDVYEVKEMDQEDARCLFCRHAFRKDSPNGEFKSVVYDVVRTTGGLPLALEVIGSFLSLKRKPIWEETLWKLKRAPKVEVQKRLQISYDMLDDDQKQMFLDVACLFIGEDIDVVMHVWKDRKFSAETGTDVLLACSLIKIGEDNRIWMHDQLRDLGREIVRKENYKQPGMRSRLWHVDEARDALEKQVIYIDNEALHLSFDSTRDNHIKNKQLRNFPNIWYLCLYDADLIGDFQHLLTNLRWFTWQYSSSKCCAININLEKLLVLDLSYSSKIRDDWEIWSSIQNAKKLRVLNLTSCMKVSTLDVSMLINLEKLILDNCVSLKEISIGKLEDLLTLSMKNCESVSTLDVFMLIHLEKLILDNCVSLKEISIGKLEGFLTLSMRNCNSIMELPIWSLPSLERLLLPYCRSIERLPDSMGKPFQITIEKLASLSKLRSLKKLNCCGCEKLQEIEGLDGLESLEEFNLEKCRAIEKLASLSKLRSLKKLNCRGCEKLQEIEGLDGLGAL